ncbi:MAG: succinate dehydrogenase cytochrome b subunit [Acidobacteriota bacterium]
MASLLWSTVAKKFLMALTGLALFLFICGHLAGNLLLFVSPEAFNRYSHRLISMGGVLYAIEILLLAVFLLHMYTALVVTWNNWKARPARYSQSTSRGEPSRMNLSSRTMIWSGVVILVFTVIHLITFKYGPGIAEGYVVYLDGEPVRDLYRLVAESFRSPLYAGWYVVAMIVLGLHLRHGFWSAVQSLGLHHPRWTPVIYSVGVAAAVLLGFGFLFIPVWFFLGGSLS